MERIRKTLALIIVMITVLVNAQSGKKVTNIETLPAVYMTEDVNLHFISPEPIQFVDISTNKLVGDLPTDNIARIKIFNSKSEVSDTLNLKSNSSKINKYKFSNGQLLGVITVVGQSFMAQYKAIYKKNKYNITTNIEVQPDDMQPLEFPKETFSNKELTNFAMRIFELKDKKQIRSVKDLKLNLSLNHIYVIDDYIFLDLSIENSSNLSYDINQLKFTIDDKKIYKATNSQTIELKPIFRLFGMNSFKKKYHNIFVFRKFTFPNSKVLKIRIAEDPISGRTIELKVKYKDILEADTI
ncbi:DUF4138 domain-containing protein [Riemerella columbipharyngis]|uniref:Bacteroides conjugative transposon TraN protein n=1 Tax=Riemerella columbipharyngis TaxID=1071918 RepID=A0A1G6ZD37_9FLAO|nr:DUF4138 domain-containing protein [Riemerella columbipharyngis]SDE00067.1 Bacteroides conjugative transposon TraN protein [Riemerella columbipharyngis]